MPHSMTGFASLAVTAGAIEFTWEIRSVNHRFLDVGLRLPEEFRRLETACRELAARYVRRGKVDCTLRAGP
ncbi:MAG TPA: YicC/YloC family endoribonuclease, partial [Gammaproteobacteria bacterium]|nr:YicC/YloC family endoribonuclease [Gammaproteobacteria bacterium]